MEDMPPNTDFGVELAPFPEGFDGTGKAIFPITKRKESRRIQGINVRPDTVVYATGYTLVLHSTFLVARSALIVPDALYSQKFDFLDPSYATPDSASTASGLDTRDILSSSDPTVAYIGFVRPGVGAIPPIAEMQAMWWVGILSGKMLIPAPLMARNDGEEAREDYHLLQKKGARIRYGVDHGA